MQLDDANHKRPKNQMIRLHLICPEISSEVSSRKKNDFTISSQEEADKDTLPQQPATIEIRAKPANITDSDRLLCE